MRASKSCFRTYSSAGSRGQSIHQNPNFGDSYLLSCQVSKLGSEIQCLCKEGELEKAIGALTRMHQYGFTPHENVFWSLLKACGEKKDVRLVRIVQEYLVRHDNVGFASPILDYLVSILAKCGDIEHALYEFQRVKNRTVFSWTALISAFTENGSYIEALEMYRNMKHDRVEPNEYTFVSILKACGSIPDLIEGKSLHADVLFKGFDSHVFVGSTLVSMYGKCGNILDAYKVFSGLPERNIVSWNAMLSAYAEQGEGEKALQLFEELKGEGCVEPNERTFVNLLQAFSMLADTEEAIRIDVGLVKLKCMERVETLYSDIQSKGFQFNVFVGNTLINMFGKCGNINRAESIFFGMSDRTVISWTAMLSAYIDHGEVEKALKLYIQMRWEEASPNEWTFAILFQACCMLADKEDMLVVGGLKMKLLALEIGRGLHSDARRSGLTLDSCVGSTLVNMYGKCGSIVEAENIFFSLSETDISAWNAILSAYLEKGQAEKVLYLYVVMQGNCLSPDERTFVTALQACCVLASKEETVFIKGNSTKKKSLDIGRALHADAQMKGFDVDIFISSTLVSMYGKCGSILDGETVFSELADRDVVTWTAMLSAYAEQGQIQNALQLYEQMQEEDVIVDDATLVCVIQACSGTGTLGICRKIHFDILSTRRDPSLLLTTAFIRAYGNCSSMLDALAIFDELQEPDVVAWSALISGYARGGKFAASFQVYDEMKQASIEPNQVTFLSLLTACGHGGQAEKGVDMFESMTTDYALVPKVEHFVTIVDLLGRVGDLERAEYVLSRMPMQPDLAMWLCLLGACRKHGNIQLGKKVFDRAVRLQPNKAAAYVMMSNIYNDAGLWDSASEMDMMQVIASE